MSWQHSARNLAERAAETRSRWYLPLLVIARHELVPNWWTRTADGWRLHSGPDDVAAWTEAAYADTSLVTRVGALHADLADPGDTPHGSPTSSATLPSLTVRMYQHTQIADSDRVLEVGTGSGYGTALLAHRLGDDQVVSVDVDPYLIDAARRRLDGIGHRPRLHAVDATGELPYASETFDRVTATVSVPHVPAEWLRVLRVGGRLVTTLAGTSLILTAAKQADGTATGRIEWDRAGFMPAHDGTGYPHEAQDVLAQATQQDGEEISTEPYPVINISEAWDLATMLELTTPGIVHNYRTDGDQHTALMTHPDGSWARATATGTEPPTVHQGGPRRLWHLLDEWRRYWLTHGELPARGAQVLIRPDGTSILARGDWHAKLTP